MRTTYSEAQKMIEKLMGCHLIRYGRVLDMFMFIFSKPTSDWRSDWEGDCSLHLQCWGRVLYSGKVLVTTEDILSDRKRRYGPEKNLRRSEWKLVQYIEANKQAAVNSVSLTENGDLYVGFDNGARLDIFIRTNDEDLEMWRYCGEEKEHHLIIADCGFEYSDDDFD